MLLFIVQHRNILEMVRDPVCIPYCYSNRCRHLLDLKSAITVDDRSQHGLYNASLINQLCEHVFELAIYKLKY